jgi:predicted O-methyltransferase YrrM
MGIGLQLKRFARATLAPIVYRYPPFALAPERLYLFLHHLVQTKDVPGPVVEIGCNLGGTTIIAKQMMDRIGIRKRYICIDTFDGFVGNQYATDVALGTPQADRHMFSGNSRELVAKILAQHGCSGVDLIEGDVTALPDALLPPDCSLVLADVDLTEPTLVALRRFWPRLSAGGAILVDDCAERTSWKARIGYSRFCTEAGLPETYQYGMGLLNKV